MQTRLRVPWNTSDPCDPRIKPGFEPASALSCRQEMNAESDLAQNDGVNHQVTLVAPQPFDGLGIGRGLGGYAEDMGDDQIGHSVSVDSDSMGTK